jgi:hypothetical protein
MFHLRTTSQRRYIETEGFGKEGAAAEIRKLARVQSDF